jgi:pilus assembly protein CpaB
MRVRTLLLVVVALILAGGTTMMARVWLASQRQQPAQAAPIAVPTPAKSVLIVRAPLQRGQLLRPDDLAWEQWPEGGIDKNYIVIGTKTPDSFAGWVVRQPLTPGEPLTEAKMIAPGNRGFLAAVLRPGMRAVTVSVSTQSGIAGFVFPGDQVDLLVTYSVQDQPRPGAQPGPMVEHKISETVLRDIRVIAIDQKLDAKAGEANGNLRTATLEVTPKQSEIIALATDMGKLSLSLRSLVPGPGELKPENADQPSDVQSSPLSETYTVDSDISPLMRGPNKPNGGGTDTVTILRGGQNSSASNSTTTPVKTGG